MEYLLLRDREGIMNSSVEGRYLYCLSPHLLVYIRGVLYILSIKRLGDGE